MKVTTTSGTAALVTPASTSASTSALIADAKLQVTVSTGAPLVSEPSRDQYDRVRASTDDRSSNTDNKRSDDANPFKALDRADLLQRDRLANSIGVDTHIDTTPEQQARLNAMMAKLAAQSREVPSKTLEGFLLLAHDGQAQSPRLGAGEQQRLTSYVQALLSRQATTEAHRVFWQQVGVNHQNVAALVQRVLRESYLMSNDMMLEIAYRLRDANTLRKAIRDELERARSTKTAWHEQSKGKESWVSSEAFGAQQINRDAFTLEPDVLDADELAQHKQSLVARGTSGAPESKTDITAAMASLSAESELTPKQSFQLEQLLRGNDDVIKDNVDLIKSALPSMNADDLRRYIEPFLSKLSHGNTDEKEIKSLFATMSPPQYLTVIADGYTAASFGFHGGDANEFRDLTVAPLYDYVDGQTFSANTGLSANDIIEHLAKGMTAMLAGQAIGDLALGPVGQVAGVIAGASLTDSMAAATGGVIGQVVAGTVGGAVGAVVGSIVGNPSKEAHTNQITPELARGLLTAYAQPAATAGDDDGSQAAADGATLGSQRTFSTVVELEDYVKGLEEGLNSIGDDAQLLNVDLQNQLQRAQNTMMMMSNLAKVLHDTAMAVIRNTSS